MVRARGPPPQYSSRRAQVPGPAPPRGRSGAAPFLPTPQGPAETGEAGACSNDRTGAIGQPLG